MTESIPRWRQDTRKWLSDDRLEAGDATVFFQPSFSHDNKIILVTGGVGPLEKRKLVKVPLQLGFWLETRGRGITHPPEWLNDGINYLSVLNGLHYFGVVRTKSMDTMHGSISFAMNRVRVVLNDLTGNQ